MPSPAQAQRLSPGRVAFAAISAVAATFTAVLSWYRPAAFQPYFGEIHPLVVIGSAIIAGGFCLAFLRSRGPFQVYSGAHDALWPLAVTVIPTLLAVPAIIADVLLRFPRDTNVAVPTSLLFYPTMGFVAEVAFHLLPLALFLLVLTPAFTSPASDRLVWAGLLFAAAAEPLFQVAFSISGRPFTLLEGFVGVHVLLFSVAALWVFRRYDFVSMYLFRLVYYAWWHVGWGTLRLHLLFKTS